jgi:N-dimethylarginine dimethylaminohydrolase
MTAPLRGVLVGSPTQGGDFSAAAWRAPDLELLQRQHEAFVELLVSLGVEVVVLPGTDGLVDGCFVYDPVFVTGAGQLVLRMCKPARLNEPERLASALEEAGVPVAGRLDGGAYADGGDMFWLDERTLAVGRGYRTNAEAHRQLAELLGREGAVLARFDLPHHHGPGEVLHLLSAISPVANDLAAVFEPLDERGIRRVHVYAASELNKGDGGPTCLTRPILRT